MGKMKGKAYALILVFFLLVLSIAFVIPRLQSIGYITAYEGAKVRFVGVYDNEFRKAYTNDLRHGASLAVFDTTLRFDRDGAYGGACNIAGEVSSVGIPMGESKWVPPSWVPTDWWSDSLYWKNPRERYSWHIANPDGTYTVYVMEEWITKWYVSISAEYDSGPDVWNLDDEAQNKRYRDLDVWFEFDIEPTWYFEGQEKVYFAIAKIELASIKTSGTPRITPMSAGSILSVFYSPFSYSDRAPSETEFKAFYYNNRSLNPQFFRDKVYAYISLNDFGTRDWWEGLTLKAEGDVVTLGFNVVLFVVGEWKVRDKSLVDDYTGRTSKVGWTGVPPIHEWLAAWWNNVVSGIQRWLSSPLTIFYVLIITIAVIAVAVMIIVVTAGRKT